MKKVYEEILRKLNELWPKSFVNVPGEVIAIDEETKTCTVKIEGIEYSEIRLNSVVSEENEKHSYIVPVIGSDVMVSFIEDSDTDGYITAFSEIDKVILNANEIIFNKGELKGLVKIEALIEKLNNIEEDLNSLKQVFSNWAPVSNDGGSALKVASGSWAGQQLKSSNLDDLENKDIKQ